MTRTRLLGLAAATVSVVALGLSALPASATADGAGRRFGPPVHVDTAAQDLTGEPSIVVAPDGSEYVVAPDGPGVRTPSGTGGLGSGGSLVWRSGDHGRTWHALGSFDVPTGGGDTDLAVTPDGTIYASGLSYLACSTISRSTDRGRSWVPMPLAGCGRTPVSNDRQWTATYRNSVVYTAIGDTIAHQIDLVRANVTGPTVVPSRTFQLSRTADYEWPGTIAVDPRSGRTYVVWNTTGAPDDCDGSTGSSHCTPRRASRKKPDDIEMSVVPNGATSAPAPRTVARRHFDTFDSFVDVTLDKTGALYVVWSERHPASGETWAVLARSTDGGRHWSRPVRVSRAPGTTTFPWVTGGDGGRIAVSYYGTPAHGNSPQTVAGRSRWYVYSSFSTDGGRHFREYRTTGVIHHGYICTSGTGCKTGTRNLLDFFESAMDRRGCLVTAYADNTVDPSVGAAVSYVRQTRGAGLLRGRRCSVPR